MVETGVHGLHVASQLIGRISLKGRFLRVEDPVCVHMYSYVHACACVCLGVCDMCVCVCVCALTCRCGSSLGKEQPCCPRRPAGLVGWVMQAS